MFSPQKLFLSLASVALIAAPFAQAQTQTQTQKEVEEIIIVGSRHKVNPLESAVPIDLIEKDALMRLPDADMDNVISRLVPSYNVNQQSVDDEATFVRPANLRGLPPDSTLIFVNGKRRHRSSVITVLGGGLSDGSHAPDISSIPIIALERVEVLLDGASAQYGSDAIAGVINFVLKDDAEGGHFSARYGQYTAGDGAKTTLGYNIGLPLGHAGALNISAETYRQDRSLRVIQRDDAQALIDAGNMHVPQPYAQTSWGQPVVKDDYKFLANMKLPLNGQNELYGFVNLAARTVDGGFYYRNPHTRSGVYKGPKEPNDTIRVVALDGVAASCSHIPIINNAPDPAALAAVQADDNCYSFYETLPGGFTPSFIGEVEDLALVAGWRGQMDNDWTYDLALSYGKHEIAYFLNNSINPQLAHEYARGNHIRDFNPGGHAEEDITLTLDFTGATTRFGLPIDVAYGFEYRNEEYTIIAGDKNASFVYADAQGDNILAAQGLSIGSNGYVGFPDSVAGSFERANYAAYADFQMHHSDRLTTGLALRYEDYEDFGDTLDAKLSARWQAIGAWAVRGAIGTGFRAPSAGQINARRVSTEFIGGTLQDAATLPATHPVAQFKGAVPLTPEEAVHITFGLVHDANDARFSLDFFNIQLTDRILHSSDLPLSAADKTALGSFGGRFDTVRFLLNDFETTTQGIDMKYDRTTQNWGGQTQWTANLNYTDTQIEKFNPQLLNVVDRALIETSLPAWRFNIDANHQRGAWQMMGRVRYYDSFYNNNTESIGTGFTAQAEWLIDAEIGYELKSGLIVTLGADNLLDNYPDKNPLAGRVGDIYAVDAPFGFNGAFYYGRLDWHF